MTGDRTRREQAVEQAVRLVEEVQTLGLACAASVADRYVDLVDRYLGQRRGSAAAASDGPGEDRLVEAAERVAQVWTRSAATMASVLREAVAGNGPPAGEVLHLPAVPPGSSTSSSVWVHNPTASPVDVTLRAGAFLAADGTTLPVGAVTEPSGPVPVEPGESAEVRLRVDVPPGASPGHFHALVTSTTTPHQAVSLHLQVLPDGPRA